MTRDWEYLTFDCYGTLVDWEQGIVAAFAAVASELASPIDGKRVLELHARIEPHVQAETFRSYREVLDLSAASIAERLGLTVPAHRESFLSESLPTWPPFPDTVPALERLRKAGYKLGILSNVDDDLLAGTLRRLAVDFDLLITAEQVGSYKPATGHFREAKRRIGDVPWLHVAQSFFHDVQPACALRQPVVWINRKGEPPRSEARPLAQFRDLAAFAEQLLDGGGLAARAT